MYVPAGGKPLAPPGEPCAPAPAGAAQRIAVVRAVKARTRPPLENTNLPEEADLIVEQLLLDDLAVLPACDSAELEGEPLVRRLVHLAVEPLPRPDHAARPVGDGAGPVPGSDHHLIGIVGELV